MVLVSSARRQLPSLKGFASSTALDAKAASFRSQPGHERQHTRATTKKSESTKTAATTTTSSCLVVYLADAWKDRAMLGGRRKLKVKAWATVRDVKFAVAKLLRIPPARQRLFFRSRELRDHRTLEESGVHRSGATLLFGVAWNALCSDPKLLVPSSKKQASSSASSAAASSSSKGGDVSSPLPPCGAARKKTVAHLEPVSCAALHGGDGALPSTLQRAMLKARRALFVAGSKAPELAMDGTGGTYFMYDREARPVACFKPADEEPFCVNNPRHFVGPYGPSSSSYGQQQPPKPKKKWSRRGEKQVRSSWLASDESVHDDENSSSDEEDVPKPKISFFAAAPPASAASSNDESDSLSSSAGAASHQSWLSMRKGVRPGEAYLREVAAYLLDRSLGGLAGVPETTLVECSHPKFHYSGAGVREKLGSFQVYAAHDGVAEDYGVDRLSVDRLQAVAALDIRGLNCDRNAANLLVHSKQHQRSSSSRGDGGGSRTVLMDVVPIDHGYCLPDVLEIEWFDWCWIDWPQVAKPVSPRLRDALLESDPFADAKALRDALGLGPDALRLVTASGLLLKKGVAAGLTLRDVASLVVVPASAVDVDSARSAPEPRGRASVSRMHRSRLAVAVDRAHELAALALRDDRRVVAPSKNWFEATSEETKTPPARSESKDLGLNDENEVTVFETKDLATLRISISPAKSSKQAGKRSGRFDDAAEERPKVELPKVELQDDDDSDDDDDDEEEYGAEYDDVRDPAPAEPRGHNPARRTDAKEAASTPRHEDSKAEFGVRPAESASKRRTKTQHPKTRASLQEATPETRSSLVRLRSCPTLVNDSSEDDVVRVTPVKASRLEGQPLQRVRSDRIADYDRQFYHFLKGLLDDLVRWKLHHRD
mmetsp:Transcript_4300/g.13434  ORF Transcript_4300/g.13434 Transcript_4300/m.13434 type:complete len:885 (+) Transcript_4300:163-2817(+)